MNKRLLCLLAVVGVMTFSHALLLPETIKEITGGFPCLGGFKPGPEVRRVMKICYEKADVTTELLLKDYNISSPTTQMIEAIKDERTRVINECMVQILGFENPDGTLNKQNIMAHVHRSKADNFVIKYRLTTMMEICLNKTTDSNATEEFTGFLTCAVASFLEYCNQEKRMVEMYLDRESLTTPCDNLPLNNKNTELIKLYGECDSTVDAMIASYNIRVPQFDAGCQRDDSKSTRFKERDFDFNRKLERDTMRVMCFMRRVGMVSEDGRHNISLSKESLTSYLDANITPELLENITEIYDTCNVKFEGNSGLQGHKIEKCFTPKIVDLCGFSNFSKDFLPVRYPEFEHMAELVTRKEIGLTQDFDDYEDEDDDEEHCEKNQEDALSEQEGGSDEVSQDRGRRAEDDEEPSSEDVDDSNETVEDDS